MQWYDNVDVICPTPPSDIVDFLSNEPIPEPSRNDAEPKPWSIQFDFDPSKDDPQSIPTKQEDVLIKILNPTMCSLSVVEDILVYLSLLLTVS